MKKSYESGVATHIGPESCGAARKGGMESPPAIPRGIRLLIFRSFVAPVSKTVSYLSLCVKESIAPVMDWDSNLNLWNSRGSG